MYLRDTVLGAGDRKNKHANSLLPYRADSLSKQFQQGKLKLAMVSTEREKSQTLLKL